MLYPHSPDPLLLQETIRARAEWLECIRQNAGDAHAHFLISAKWQRFIDLAHTMKWGVMEVEQYLARYEPEEYHRADGLGPHDSNG